MLKRFSAIALFVFAFAGMAKAADKDIVETATAAKDFTTLLKAATEAGLVDTLKSKGPFTVFAPNDKAFAKIPKETLAAVLKDKEKLKAILLAHVVAGKVMAKDVKSGKVKTAGGYEVEIVANADGVTVDGSKVIATDIEASNGVIHVIDTVILPKN
ncbi:fasciclin domain-containing protein [Telmatocola sphagniphila]|uniref:Fasciclin domain-containing protein n=1 Tax=Telmatocola sphagniphila TaxID=1123043 RepID=A0A8E6B8W1_9BACT|nr:fasciclin domain-containing protein [Telmatocola sphagniphila]QVL33429.1 fasciclin domain-containing protein [Telmatocola sphagniphila]